MLLSRRPAPVHELGTVHPESRSACIVRHLACRPRPSGTSPAARLEDADVFRIMSMYRQKTMFIKAFQVDFHTLGSGFKLAMLRLWCTKLS
jgi:hypothetical protein